MNTLLVIRHARYDWVDGHPGAFVGRPAVVAIDGVMFFSETPGNAGEAASINNRIGSLAYFPAAEPKHHSRAVFQ